jgi:hypothetical protein
VVGLALNYPLIFLFLVLNGLWKSGQQVHVALFSTDSAVITAFFYLFFFFLTTALIGGQKDSKLLT